MNECSVHATRLKSLTPISISFRQVTNLSSALGKAPWTHRQNGTSRMFRLPEVSSLCRQFPILAVRWVKKNYLIILVCILVYHQTNFIVGDVWNTEFDTFWFAAVGIQTTEPNLTNGALAASWILGGEPGVCFKLIYAVLCLPSRFENCIFWVAEYSKILSFFAIWQKISMPWIIRKDEVFHGLL